MILSKLTPPWRGKPLFFQPPFPYLGWVVWGFVVFCYLLHPDSAILRGELPDTDDYMYLTQVIDWLKGQGWFDNTQYRLNPPDGTMLHFTRLVQLPLAGIIAALHHGAGLSWITAATIAAAIWPLVLLMVLFASLRWTATAFVSRDWRNLAPFVALFAPVVMFQYMPGRVDHTGLIIIMVTLALGCVLSVMTQPERRRWPLLAGTLLAIGLAVALEILPWLLLLAAWIGFWMLWQGRLLARAGVLFGLSLYLTACALLALLRPPAVWMQPDLLWFSSAYVALCGMIACCLVLAALLNNLPHHWLRLLLGGLVAIGAGTAFLLHLPQLITGPYGDVQPRLADLLLQNIGEAIPLNNSVKSVPDLLIALALPLLGLLACFAFWHDAKGQQRWQWLLLLLLLFTAVMLATFYQKRFLTYAQLFSILPLMAFVQQVLGYVSALLHGGKLLTAKVGLILAVGFLPGILLPAINENRSLYPDLVLFPMLHSVSGKECRMNILSQILLLPDYYGDHPRRIMAMINEGPELLFRTPHSVYAAPYHTNVKGNLLALDFFSARDPAVSERLAHDHKIDLVVMCTTVPKLYLGESGGGLVKLDDPHWQASAEPRFVEQLAMGKIPEWLNQPQLFLLQNYLVFEVKPRAPSPPDQP